jgi:serine protease inhibitor
MTTECGGKRGASGIRLAALLFALAIFAIASPRADPQSTSPLATAVSTPINDFGFRLLHKLTDGNGRNVIVSPLSVSLALAMTYNGADGATRTAIAKTLGAASLSDEAINSNNRQLLDTIEKADPAVQMEVANALWTQAGFAVSPGFLKVNRDFYDASVQSLDFAGNPRHAVATINAWVNEKTHAKIPEILNVVDPATVVVLTDAVYFKGRWTVPFDKQQTAPRAFHLHGGATVNAPMMVQNGEYPYFENDLYQAIRLPYGNHRFAMYIFLPRKSAGLANLLRKFDATHWGEMTAKLDDRKGEIVLPKFESTYSEQLNDALISMGMGVAFSGRADFSRIHPPPPPLTITDVAHKTYVKVDEEGTEAAAATSVSAATAGMIAEPPPFEMVVDHPFFCAITEGQSGALLFAGVVTDPTQH